MRASLLVFVLTTATLAVLSAAQGDTAAQCTGAIPGPPYDDAICLSDPLAPFCSQDTAGTPRCHPCNPWRRDWWCDCPANYYCLPFIGRPQTGMAGTCVPFDRATRPCSDATECDGWIVGASETIFLWRFSCINGYCRVCNQTYFGGAAPRACGPWDTDTQTGSSRPGETRACTADGYIVGGGAINVTGPPSAAPVAPSSAPPRSTAASASTSGAPGLIGSAVLVLFAAFSAALLLL